MKARHPIVRGIVSLLLVSLLAGCAGSGAKRETEAARTGPEVTQIGPGPVAQEQPGFDLEALSGLWVMQEVEAEGDRVSAELAGLSVELLLREDGTADYIELTAAGKSTEHLNLILDGDGDGRLDFSYEGGVWSKPVRHHGGGRRHLGAFHRVDRPRRDTRGQYDVFPPGGVGRTRAEAVRGGAGKADRERGI